EVSCWDDSHEILGLYKTDSCDTFEFCIVNSVACIACEQKEQISIVAFHVVFIFICWHFVILLDEEQKFKAAYAIFEDLEPCGFWFYISEFRKMFSIFIFEIM
ncbi:25453_t:CDS:2, partial [Racocetra persica]